MAYYSTCPLCGGSLDPGERCDCEVERNRIALKYEKNLHTENDGQVVFDFLDTAKATKEDQRKTVGKNKKILDPCCGSKMFWFDTNNPNVEFCDIRKLDKQEYYPGRYIEINPDTICDFTNLPFENNMFYLVVFDPPHLRHSGKKSIMRLKYGTLNDDWKETLRKGFDECMRVLKPNGVLIFKWSEIQITLSEILPLFRQAPLFGNKYIKKGRKTHWLCFMKMD